MIYYNKYLNYKNNLLNNEIIVKSIKNSGWLIGDKLFTMVIGVFVIAIVARYFGPEKFGQLNYALSITELFTAISVLGLETLTVQAVIAKKYDEGTILGTSFILRIFGGIALITATSIVIRTIEPNDVQLQVLVLFFSLGMVFRSIEVIEYWIQAHQKAKISSIIRMSSYVLLSVLKLLLVWGNGSLIQYAIIYLIDITIVSTALVIAYCRFRDNKVKWHFNSTYAREILLQSWPIILSGLMITMYLRLDQVMLGLMLPNKNELGIYSSAVQIASMWYFVPAAIITSFKPIIMKKKMENKIEYLKTLQLLYTVITWVSICFGILIIVFADFIIGTIYGNDFAKAASILNINIWSGTFAMIGCVNTIWLVCEGFQRYTIFYTFIGFIVNLVLNLILIPQLGGYGAAIATLLGQISANALGTVFFKETRISSMMIIKSFNPKGVLTLFNNLAK